MMPSCPYFILSTPLSLNMWTYFSLSASTWGQVRSKLGGVDMSILHHAFISMFIASWAVTTHYVKKLMTFLSYFTGFTWSGRMPADGIPCGKGANIRDLFCTTPKVLKLHESQFWNILKILGEESTRGGHPPSTRVGDAPLSCGPPGRPPVSIFCYMRSFALEKIIS